MIYRAISIRQPWADFILRIGKDIENRSANSPVIKQLSLILAEYRQPITVLIHAGKHDKLEYNENAITWALDHMLIPEEYRRDVNSLPRGGIVGVARVRGLAIVKHNKSLQTIGTVPNAYSEHFARQMPTSPWVMGDSDAFIYFDKAAPIPFVPCRGYQHLFKVDEIKVGEIQIPDFFK